MMMCNGAAAAAAVADADGCAAEPTVQIATPFLPSATGAVAVCTDTSPMQPNTAMGADEGVAIGRNGTQQEWMLECPGGRVCVRVCGTPPGPPRPQRGAFC